MALRKKAAAAKAPGKTDDAKCEELQRERHHKEVLRAIRRAGIISGVLSMKGPGSVLTAGLIDMIDTVEEALDQRDD